MDDTSQKIIDATMSLVRDKGYVATTTKDIAHLAGVNECTLFRKFKNKKDIVLNGVAQEKWRANITPEIFENVTWELQSDFFFHSESDDSIGVEIFSADRTERSDVKAKARKAGIVLE